MRIVTFVFFGGIAFLSNAQAGTVSDNYIGCITEEHLDQMTTALVRKDERLYKSLMGKFCVPVQGQEFSVLDQGFITSQIRVYIGNESVDLWVPSEATR